MTNPEPKAPTGKFRVLGLDTFHPEEGYWLQKDCETQKEAVDIAVEHTVGVQMTKYYVYDDQGKLIFEAGSW